MIYLKEETRDNHYLIVFRMKRIDSVQIGILLASLIYSCALTLI
jgi:hypothetical protein